MLMLVLIGWNYCCTLRDGFAEDIWMKQISAVAIVKETLSVEHLLMSVIGRHCVNGCL